MKYILFIEIILLFTNSCSGNKIISLEPAGLEKFKALTIKAGDLKVVFIHNPKIKKEYSFKARMIYKPYKGDQDILEEYETWAGNN